MYFQAPVTALHSYCMRHQIDVPHIELINSEGEAHKPIFTMLCQVSLRGEIVSAEGKGTKKIAAKHESAARMVRDIFANLENRRIANWDKN